MPASPSAVAQIVLTLHDNGGLQIGGHIGDVALAHRILDAAREAITRQMGPRERALVVPDGDVGVTASGLYPLDAEGSRPGSVIPP